MNSINIEQYEFDAAVKHFFMLNPVYEWGGNVQGSYKDSIRDGSLMVDSVGMVRAIYEMITGQVLENVPNAHLMGHETDRIPLRDACPGDLIFSGSVVSMVASDDSRIVCYTGDLGIVIVEGELTEGMGEIHRGFVRVSGS